MNCTHNIIDTPFCNDFYRNTFNETIVIKQKLKAQENIMNIILIVIFFLLLKLYTDKYGNSKRNKKSLHESSLSNVVGLESVKEEIKYYMDFIDNKSKYKKWNVQLPKGILLAGPPGTGKTLLVKTIAKNLDIPIVSMCGSEFVEKYVGVGASRVRELFNKAKRKNKCIVFIDEIDAVGKKRGLDNNSERDSTLNQLLVEMDGFEVTDNIIVFAATNLVKNLDSALVRSGRFDKKVYFDPPNFKERKDLYKLYFNNVVLPENINYDILSERSVGLTGADIANVCNQSKINAIQADRKNSTVNDLDIYSAIDEIMIGREKRERTMSDSEKTRVARHEAGHALMGYLLQDCTHPVKVSIVPRGEAALGFSQQKNVDKKLYTRNNILSHISILLGGRCAEKVFYNQVSSGAADDIEKASSLIYQYCCVWGMHEKFGPLNPTCMGKIGENISNDMFAECNIIITKLERFVIQTLEQYKKYMGFIADDLLKNETISFEKILELVPSELQDSIAISHDDIFKNDA